MKHYKHYNPSNGTLTIYDSKGVGHTLKPYGTVVIDRVFEQNGIVCVGIENDARDLPIEETEAPKKELTKKHKGDKK